MKSLNLSICLLINIIVSSCTSTYNSSIREVVFNSKPKGMSVIINDSLYGKTPLIAGLNIMQDNSVKYKYFDSVVYFEKIYHWTGDDYNTYIYFNLNNKDTNFKTNIINTKDIDKESSYNFRENIYRKYSSDWSIFLNNHKEFEELKLLNIVNNQIEFTLKDTSNIDFKNYIISKNLSNPSYSIPIDSISSIANYKKIPSADRLKTALIWTIIGSFIGYEIDNYIVSHPKDNKSYNSNSTNYAGVTIGGFVGCIIGIIKSIKDYHVYKLNDLNNEERIKLIKKEILLIDE